MGKGVFCFLLCVWRVCWWNGVFATCLSTAEPATPRVCERDGVYVFRLCIAFHPRTILWESSHV